jgi:hypothetical protein
MVVRFVIVTCTPWIYSFAGYRNDDPSTERWIDQGGGICEVSGKGGGIAVTSESHLRGRYHGDESFVTHMDHRAFGRLTVFFRQQLVGDRVCFQADG